MPAWPWIKPTFNRIARFAPLIGLILGFLKISIWLTLYKLGWPILSLPFIVLAFEIFITGGLHFDGLIDTFDGIAAGKNKQIKAMEDSSAGAIGVISSAMIILIQLGVILKLSEYSLIAFPISSFCARFSSLCAISAYPYLKKEGAGKFHKANWKGNYKEFRISFIVIFLSIIILLILDQSVLYHLKSILIGLSAALIVPKLIGDKLGGQTGDSYGACVVIVETLSLLGIAIISPVI